MSTAQSEQIAPPSKKKFPLILKKTCFGTFRDDFSNEKKAECHTCSKYVDCIQRSYKERRQCRQEIRRLVGTLQRRVEILSGEASSGPA